MRKADLSAHADYPARLRSFARQQSRYSGTLARTLPAFGWRAWIAGLLGL